MAEDANPKTDRSSGAECDRRAVLRSLGGAAAVAGVGSAGAAAETDDGPTQLRVENTETAFQKLSDSSVRALLDKLSEEGFLPQVTADATELFPVTTLETDREGGVGRFETGSWFGEQHVFVAHLDDAEIQIIVSERGAPSAMIDPVDTDNQRVVSLSESPGRDELTSRYFEVQPAQVACDIDCWCEGCCCCCPLKGFKKTYCREEYDGECITTNRCRC